MATRDVFSAEELARLRRFPAITRAELIRYFTVTRSDEAFLRKFHGRANVLGASVQLASLPWLGFAPDEVTSAPPPAVGRLAERLGIPAAELAGYGQREQTRTEHLREILAYTGWRVLDPPGWKEVDEFLFARAMEHDSPKLLFRQACDYLRSEQVVRSGVVSLLEHVASARERARGETWMLLSPLVAEDEGQAALLRRELDRLLVVDPDLGCTPLRWLETGPATSSPAAVKIELAKLAYLRRLDAHTLDLSMLPTERRRFLAGLGRRLTGQALARRDPERRYPILLALLAESELHAALADLDAQLAAGDPTGVRLNADGELIIPPLSAEDTPSEADALRGELAKILPVVPIASLLVEVDARTGFTGHLTHGAGKATRSPELKRHLLYVLLAEATNMSLAEMAASAGISYEVLAWTAEWYFRPETLEPANALIVNYHHELPFAQVSGTGTLSSSDGQRFPVSGKSITAAHLSRYFARGAGVSTYTAVSDQHATFDTKVIAANVPEAPLVLDEVLGNATDLPITEHATDTHGVVVTWTPLVLLAPPVPGFDPLGGGGRAESGGVRAGSAPAWRRRFSPGRPARRWRRADRGCLGVPAVPGGPGLLAQHARLLRLRPPSSVAVLRPRRPGLGGVCSASLDRAAGVSAVGAFSQAPAADGIDGGGIRRGRAGDEAGRDYGEPDPRRRLLVL